MKISSTVALSLLLAPVAAKKNPFPLKQPKTTNTRKAKALSKLIEKAKPVRKLDEEEEAEVDLSGYSIKFEKCTSVKQWSYENDGNNNNNNNEGVDDKLVMNRFALFRLCPTEYYSSCNKNYGEYLINLEDYLMSTTEYFQNQQEEMCNECDENCQNDDANGDGDGQGDDANAAAANNYDCSCVDECDKIENMENNGYMEATNYIECQELEQENDDDNGVQYFAGATCSSDGSKIKIGVYKDEDCTYLNSNLYVDDYLNGFKLSHALLKNVYSGTEIPCSVEADEDDDGAEPEENEACQNLYEAAAGCESDYGFYGYEQGNRAANEDVVCDFISQVKGNSYDPASGEIVLKGKNSVKGGGSSTTGGQKFALTVLVLGTIGLAVYAATIHSQLTKGGKADLSQQGGQMA